MEPVFLFIPRCSGRKWNEVFSISAKVFPTCLMNHNGRKCMDSSTGKSHALDDRVYGGKRVET